MDYFDDDLEILDIIDYGFPRRVYQRSNHFEEVDPMSFFKRFRLYKETVLHVLELIEGELEYPTNRNHSLSPINQLLCCLRFFASSRHIIQVADFMGIDVATASRTIAKVSRILAGLFRQFVYMPEHHNLIQEQNKFYNIARFPRVIGLIDGTHIKIQSPGGNNAEVYRNRKSYFSLNVQVVGNADIKFVDVVARWPGSAHDSTIFANSNLRTRFEMQQFPNSLLIGDSGYPLKNYLLTPLHNPLTRPEQLYNESIIRTRNGIERQIGLWKRRFPVIAYGLRLHLETTKAIIIATTVLHNIARNMNEPEPPLPDDLNIAELNYLIETADVNIPAANNVNVNIVQNDIINYFATL